MFRIGNQTSFSAPPMRPFEFAVENGFEAFEWFPDRHLTGEGWDMGDIDATARRLIKETALKQGISLSVHAPLGLSPLRGEGAFAETISFAKDIGAGILNIHLVNDRGLGPFAEAISRLKDKLGGIGLSVENTPITAPEDFNALFSLLGGIDGVGMCFDMGHANLFGGTKNDYIGFLGRLESHVPVIHLHMHENHGEGDSHLALFSGPSGGNPDGIKRLIGKMKERGFSGSVIFEQWPEPPGILIEARRKLKAIIGERPASGGPPQGGKAEGFMGRLIESDRNARSYREKLKGVAALLDDETPGAGGLSALYVYLKFINSGEIKCLEDGRHFRPSNHARLSLAISGRLDALESPETASVIRRLRPLLPSHEGEFLRAEPLTRIRDIAHRNDIPKELKSEIKHTLQNKLHRCAGPEDLETSALMLERISGGGYPDAFVGEFKIFHEELKEFFNAGALSGRLRRLLPASKPADSALIKKVLSFKESENESYKELLGGLEALSRLRLRLAEMPLPQRSFAPTDAAVEDFVFVVLSRLINALDSGGIREALNVSSLALENMALSGIEPKECRALEAEFLSLTKEEPIAPLRLKAALDRCERLVEGQVQRTFKMFEESSGILGRALGVEEHAVKTFAEGDLRGSVAFQLSKLISGISAKLRRLAALPLWDAIVTGRAEGRLIHAGSLDEIRETGEGIIVHLSRAEGDEEIAPFVRGIILGREVPRLSHLALRARQAKVVCAVCEDRDEFNGLKGLSGSTVALDVSPDSVRVERKSSSQKPDVRVLGLFQKRFAGDDALLRLAALRFKEAGLGAEVHASGDGELEALMEFTKDISPVTVHLERGIDLLDGEHRRFIAALARRFAGRIYGIILHDQREIENRFEDYVSSVRMLDGALRGIKDAPLVFIEYAVFLDPELYAGVFEAIGNLSSISACIDTGHIGIRKAAAEYSLMRPGGNVLDLRRDASAMKAAMGDVQEAVGGALSEVLRVIKRISEHKKTVHFHLHDGHPFSSVSDAGVSDHVSFGGEIPLPFNLNGKGAVRPMFGPSGLSSIVREALSSFDSATFTLEIHPDGGRSPLGKYAALFNQWPDKTNAEKMNHWLSEIVENQRLLAGFIGGL